eukprot:sb/3479199/
MEEITGHTSQNNNTGSANDLVESPRPVSQNLAAETEVSYYNDHDSSAMNSSGASTSCTAAGSVAVPTCTGDKVPTTKDDDPCPDEESVYGTLEDD